MPMARDSSAWAPTPSTGSRPPSSRASRTPTPTQKPHAARSKSPAGSNPPDYPAVRALDLDQPVIIDGHPVTFWEALSDNGDEYATIGEVADVIARLHKLTPPEGLALPPLEPFDNAERPHSRKPMAHRG